MRQVIRKVLILKLSLALTLVSSVVVFGMAARMGVMDKRPTVTLTGIVTDSFCGIDHGTKTAVDPECTRTCVDIGAQYALAVGKIVYVLHGPEAVLDRYAGESVRVKGRVASRNTVIVDQVVPWYAEAASEKK